MGAGDRLAGQGKRLDRGGRGRGEGQEGCSAQSNERAGLARGLRTRDGECDLRARLLFLLPPLLGTGWKPGSPRLSQQ